MSTKIVPRPIAPTQSIAEAAAARRHLLEDGHLGQCPECGDLGPAGERCFCGRGRHLLHIWQGEPRTLAA